MSGPGPVTREDVRKRVTQEFSRFSQAGQEGTAGRIKSGYESAQYEDYILNIFNTEGISTRTKEETALDFLNHDSYAANWNSELGSAKIKKAKEQVAGGYGSEFSRVLREKYVKQSAATPGRRATILSGRL